MRMGRCVKHYSKIRFILATYLIEYVSKNMNFLVSFIKYTFQNIQSLFLFSILPCPKGKKIPLCKHI